MSISSLGIGSGLDLNNLTEQILESERKPAADRLDRREVDLQARISAFGAIRSGLSGLQSALGKLGRLEQDRTAQSTNPDAVLADAQATAEPGRYSVQVERLASAQSLASTAFADGSGAALGTGQLQFQVGDNPAFSVTVDDSNNTLRGLRDAINRSDRGVEASIINDASGARLIFSSTATGAENTLTITAAEGSSEALQKLSSDNLEQTVAASDAQATINGLTVTSASNRLDNVVEGLNLTLQATTEFSGPVSIEIGLDRDSVTAALNEVVTAYNGVMKLTRELTQYNPETDTAALMVGDSTVRTIRSTLANGLMTRSADFDNPINSLMSLGIRSNDIGELTVDEAALNRGLNQDLSSSVSLLNDFANDLRDSVRNFTRFDGLIDIRNEGLDRGLDDVRRQRETLNLRMDRLEASLVQRFGAMDRIVGQLQGTSDYLTQQFSSMNNMLNSYRNR